MFPSRPWGHLVLLRANTLTALWEGTADRMFYGTVEEGIFKGSSMTICYDHFLRCDSMQYEMDVWRDLHLTKSRFPVLQRTYLTLEEYEAFFVRARNVIKNRGAVTRMSAVAHKPRGVNRTKKTGNYAHGGCILGWTFRVDKATKQPILGMHSRVSYLPYMGGLDLALCYVIAKELGAELGYDHEDFGFRWYVDSLQFAHMQSVSYVWNRPELMEAIDNPEDWPDAHYPTIKLMRNTINSFRDKKERGFKPEEEKFAQLMRYRRRWENRVDGTPWPDIPVDTLTLDALRNPTRRIVDEEDDG
jgi:hypothetical protein